ncbi:PriCT-2 domain-containing protein [Aeromonas allosaccharophila]|uniref:VapE domain-containing protein n=1 Tax=Aeromonas allosaccharophila TaxID=656 RepID=UPI001BCF3202|nr:VapE domain-containing protein [Aeromonas allosaccharophila]MBS4694504.1 PriCT-2 domain-containing protein [Aeromonas allosaccharophila]
MQPKYNDLSDPSQGNWRERQLCVLCPQYNCLPVFISDKGFYTAKHADGQTYPIGHPEWDRSAEDVFAIKLEDNILIDWDMNKNQERVEKGLPPVAQLSEVAGWIGMTEDELWDQCVQWNKDKTSLHFLFHWPEGFNPELYKHHSDEFMPGVDIKTGNQIVNIKRHKENQLYGFPTDPAPPLLVEALKRPRKQNNVVPIRRSDEWTFDETERMLGYISPDIGESEWWKVINGVIDQLGKTDQVFAILDRWSSTGSKYQGSDDVRMKFDRSNAGGGTGIGTVVHMAQENGYVKAKQSAAEAFKGYQLLPDSPKLVERAQAYPDLSNDKQRKPLQTSANLKTLLKNMGIQIATNKMNLNLDIEQGGLIVELSFDALRSMIIDEAQKTGLPIQTIDHHLVAIGEQNSYHPVAAALQGRHWDCIERVQLVLDCLPCADPLLKDAVMWKWLISVIAAIYEPIFSSKLVPVLKGGQSTRKSAFLSRVCSIVANGFLPEASLDAENKDSVIIAASRWIVELSELERTTRKEAGALKAHLTKDVDTFRAPYARSAINKKRQTGFIATVNDDEFLRDPTGNSRFSVIELTGKISLDAVNDILGYSYDNGRIRQTDREQLLQFWLEVKHRYDTGWSWVLNDDEAQRSEENNSKFMVKGDFYHLIEEKFNTWWPNDTVGVSASEACSRLNQPVSLARKVGKDLAQMEKEGLLRRGEGRNRRTYFKA